MSRAELVDWALAERVAVAVAARAGGPSAGTREVERDFGDEAVAAACAEASTRVGAYSRLRPSAPPPGPESVERPEWARVALGTLRELTAELEATGAVALPGPAGALSCSVLGAATGLEAGTVVGYAATKVMGQYDLALLGGERPPRLLFVSTNLAAAREQLDEPPAAFLRWIALHETTHAFQFAAVPWLRDHIADLLRALIAAAARRFEPRALVAALAGALRSDPRTMARRALGGELGRAIAGPEQAALLDRLQATMALIEGHAEHVMDAAADREDRAYGRLRRKLDARRLERNGLDAVIARLLGLEAKLRQYRLGKGFCDGVVARGGVDALNEAWAGPDSLPSLAELSTPGAWLARVAALREAA